MKYILLKTFRDIRETIGSFVSILIIIFIGCFFFAGISEATSSITRRVDKYFAMQNIADARAEFMYVNSPAVDIVAAADGVIDAAGYNTFNSKARLDGARFDISVTTLTQGIDDPYIVSGRMPMPDNNEIIIDRVFAEEHSVPLGTQLTFDVSTLEKMVLEMSVDAESGDATLRYTPQYRRVEYTFEVVGIYHSADIIYKVNMLNTAATPDEFIMAQVHYSDIASYTDDAKVVMPIELPPSMGGGTTERVLLDYSTLEVDVFTGIKVLGGKDYDELFNSYALNDEDDLTDMFANPQDAAGLFMYVLERENFPSVTAFNGINDTLAALAGVLPLLFFAVAAAITVISLSKTVDNQRMQIGVIQALGVSKSRVYFSYIFYSLFASLIGGFAGGLAGTFFVPFLLNIIYNNQFSMPPITQSIHVGYMFVGVAISAALACLSAFLSCYKTLKTVPAQAMRPKPPKKTKRILAERWTWLWSRLGFGAKMNLRNMFLHKVKMLLSSIGIVGCLALLVALLGLKDNMAFSFDRYDGSVGYDLTIITNVAVDLTDGDIYESVSTADEAKYIDKLTFAPDFSGRFTFNGKSADLNVMALPTRADADDYMYADPDCVKLYTDLKGKSRVIFDDDTFVIPHALADKLGAKAGDTVHISGYSLDNHSFEFDVEITAVVYEYFEQKAYCSYAVFENKGVGLLADTSYAKPQDGVSLDEAIGSLKDNDVVRDVKTFRETYDALQTQMSLLDWAVIIFVIGAGALAIAVIYNVTATNLKDRTREIATLMVLGYKGGETANMLIAENMVITMLGCVLGLPLGYGLMIWLVDITTSFNVFITSFLSWYVAVGCVVLTFMFSLLATLLLNTRLKKISMVEALKSVE